LAAYKNFRAKLTNLSANTPEASGTGVTDPTLRIKGYEPGNGKIELYILSETTSIHTGVYPFTIDKQRSGVYTTGGIGYYAGPPGFFSPGGMLGSGTITITEVSKRHVSGTFEFTTSSTAYNITEGSFSIDRN
jgi:hypothetical protein